MHSNNLATDFHTSQQVANLMGLGSLECYAPFREHYIQAKARPNLRVEPTALRAAAHARAVGRR